MQPPEQNNPPELFSKVKNARPSARTATLLPNGHRYPNPTLSDALVSLCNPFRLGEKWVTPTPPTAYGPRPIGPSKK
jgi:hypothetical protein